MDLKVICVLQRQQTVTQDLKVIIYCFLSLHDNILYLEC